MPPKPYPKLGDQELHRSAPKPHGDSGKERESRSQPNRQRRRIYGSAVRLFTRHGFHATSMKQLAADLGMTQANLYNYYSGKEEILFDVLRREMATLLRRERLLAEEADNPIDRVRALAYDLVTLDLDDPVAAFVSSHGLDGLSDEHRLEISKRMGEVRSIWRDAIDGGLQRGLFDCPEPQLASLTALTLCSFVSSWFNPTGSRSRHQVAAYTAAACLTFLGYGEAWENWEEVPGSLPMDP